MRRSVWIFFLLSLSGLSAIGLRAGNEVPWRFPPASRIVAIGDLHGDLDAARRALRLAGAIDDHDRWIGGTLVIVQTGDQIDRGDDEQAILDLFARLREEAALAGGAVYALNGNHELMNAALDFRYVSPGGLADFEDAVHVDETDSLLVSFEATYRARAAAFRPGGPYARILARRNTAIVIGSSVFVHGGVLPDHLDHGLGCVNGDVREWLEGTGPYPKWMLEKGSPVWTRTFSLDVDSCDCVMLRNVLERLGARRMIVGHTDRVEGIISYCDSTVWCIDAGMSRHYGGRPQVLEIKGDTIHIIIEKE